MNPTQDRLKAAAIHLAASVLTALLGPLLTLVIFNRAKPQRELRRDLAVVVQLQILRPALGQRAG